MKHLIDKDALVAEIESRIKSLEECFNGKFPMSQSVKETEQDKGKLMAYKSILSLINSLEVKRVDTWHLQEKEDIYDAVKDWGLYTFACIMKDGTIQRFTGNLDEDCEGHINVHIDGANDDYDNVDDIVKWIEIT